MMALFFSFSIEKVVRKYGKWLLKVCGNPGIRLCIFYRLLLKHNLFLMVWTRSCKLKLLLGPN